MSNYLALRSSAAPTFTVSTLLAKSISIQSTTISLGQSTNQTYTNFSNGSFTTGWASTLTGLTSIKDVVLSPNGSIQTILQNSGSTMSTTITSLNSGSTWTWTGSTMRGLPTSGALPYQTYGSTINAMPVPSITAITAAASSGNQLAIASNELVYASANSGATFAATGLGQNNSPFIYLPFDGSVTDVMGNSAVTATATSGSISYVPGKVGTNAVNLANTAGGTATQYLRGTWTGSNSFTVSFWFNAQTINASQVQYIFASYNTYFAVAIATTNTLNFIYPTGNTYAVFTGPVIAANTWYNVVGIVQSGGLCSFYVNNALIMSATNIAITTSTTLFSIGCFDTSTAVAFNGYIDDFRLYNYAVTNPSGAALINPLVGPIMPYVYLTFDGSSITTDVMGNSTVTATGSPSFVAGQVGSNAIYFANAGTGSNPTQYLTGTVSGLGNAITFSCWFQALILPSSGAEVVWGMNAVTSGNIIVQFAISTTGIVSFQYFNGSAWQGVYSASAISLNTWYHAVCIYQGAGTFSLYLNGALTTNTGSGVITPAIASYTIGGANASPNTPTFGFRGYVDDFRIYNGAFTPSQLSPVLYSPSFSTGSPNIYLPFENGSVLDVMGYSAVSARGTMNFVPGVVGSTALNLVNPAGGNAVNHIRATCSPGTNFTVSLWFNLQAYPDTSSNSAKIVVLGTTADGNFNVDVSAAGLLRIITYRTGAVVDSYTISTISTNTWYNLCLIFQQSGTSLVYLNGVQMLSYTGPTLFSAITTMYIGANHIATQAFNGYIDDFKIYNCAVPFNALGPMNYTQAAISNSGAYQVVAAANGGVYTSANSGSTWSQAVTSPQPAPAVNTVGGQVITPNLTGLAAATWTQNGVNWAASSSTVYQAYYAYNVFNTLRTDDWLAASNTYTTAGNTSGITMTIQGGVGTVTGDWLQIQSSVPLAMSSYQFATGYITARLPKTYYIVGSNDGSTWYPIQYGSGGTITTALYTLVPGIILVNNASAQTFGSSTITTTIYSTTTNSYTYFRLVILSSYSGSADYVELSEWYINFATPATPLYVAPSTALIANQSLNAITVMPQQTGLASNTWTTNGVSWVVSASSSLAGYPAYAAFSNVIGTGWANSVGTSYTSTTYSGAFSTTVLGSVGAVTGEWIQIQSSVPVVLSTYSYTNSGNTVQQAQTYYIVGSTDGTSWYPIHRCSAMSANPFPLSLSQSNYLSVTSSGSVPFIASAAAIGTFETYPTSSNAYTYFRFITRTNYNSAASYVQIGQIYYNFTAYTPALLQSLSVSPSGQYMALTGAGAVAPQLTGLTGNTSSSTPVPTSWVSNGVTWTCNASSVNSPNFQPWVAFNNVAPMSAPSVPYSWATPTAYNTSGFYTGSVTTTVLGGVGTVSGEWLQIQSSVPLIMSSYTFAMADYRHSPKTGYIVGSNDGTTWYPIQNISMTTNPLTANWTSFLSNIIVNQTGTQTIQGAQLGSGNFQAYPTTANTYTYFRIIATSIWTNVYGNFEFTEWYINFQSGTTFYSTDYGSSWTRSLTAATIPNANVLATSGNGQYSLQASGQTVIIANNTSGGNPTGSYTTPTFSPVLSNTVSNAAVSASGQYMVLVTQGTTNNVYYSSNYGVSFTGITLGSTAMVSCAVSADGSYITVANQTQVFTLNSNTQGLSITVGNQSGLTNQGQNAVAIGNQAGQTNQSANSIVLNSSGSVVNAYVPGFFVAPVSSASSSVSSSFAVLGYGTDNQVVQTGMTVLTNGFVGIGISPVNAQLQFASTITNRKIVLWDDTLNSDHQYYGFGVNPNILRYQVPATSANHVFYAGTSATTSNELMRVTGGGLVGIGTANPVTTLHVNGSALINTGIAIGGANVINFGYDVTKDSAAGKIGYQTFAPFTSLDIVGAGTNNTTRSIKLYDNVIVQGSISKASGTFDIGHPLYSDTPKRLVHSFIEGPRCDLIYRGKTTLIDGSALVNIDKECTHSPECAMDEGTFEALCDNPQIFLQNNQSFDRVRGVISGATLTITCENPASVEIEWMVIAERADPFIKKWERTNPDGYLITQYSTEDNTTEMPSE